MNSTQREIYRYLLDLINDPGVGAGFKLPTEAELSSKFNTTRLNAATAIRVLTDSGIVFRNKRQGTLLRRQPSALERYRLERQLNLKLVAINYIREGNLGLHWNERLRKPLRKQLAANGIELEEIYAGETPDAFGTDEIIRLADNGMNAVLLIPGGYKQDADVRMLNRFYEYCDRLFIFDRSGHCRNVAYCNVVGIDNFADGILAGEMAAQINSRQVVFCFSDSISLWADERAFGVRRGLHRIIGDKVFMSSFICNVHGEFPELDLHSLPIVIAENIVLAKKLLLLGRERGLEAGRDYGLITFGNQQPEDELAITTFAPDLECIGRLLGNMISSVMCKKNEHVITTQMVSSKLQRGKTFPLKKMLHQP